MNGPIELVDLLRQIDNNKIYCQLFSEHDRIHNYTDYEPELYEYDSMDKFFEFFSSSESYNWMRSLKESNLIALGLRELYKIEDSLFIIYPECDSELRLTFKNNKIATEFKERYLKWLLE